MVGGVHLLPMLLFFVVKKIVFVGELIIYIYANESHQTRK